MRVKELVESQQEQAIHLTKLGKFHKGEDELANYVPERITHFFDMGPISNPKYLLVFPKNLFFPSNHQQTQ